MATVVEWYPASGGSARFTTGTGASRRLISLDGLEAVPISPVSIKSPNQPGDTVVDVVLPGRTVTLVGLLQADTSAEVWDLRAALMRTLVQQPTRLGEEYALGRLRVTLDGRVALEIDALPASVKVERPNGTRTLAPFDIEFYCPNPFWKEIEDSQILFTGAGGFEWSLEFSLEMPSNNVEVEIVNEGDVDTPILARLYGDITTGRIMNLTTGETLEITGNLPATKYWEVDTRFGGKRVDEVTIATGASVSAMDKINLSLPDFWMLRPGTNVVKFEADTNTSGRAEMYWRERYSGF